MFVNTAVCTDYSKKFGVFNVFASSQEFLMEVVALKSSNNSQKTNKQEQEFELVHTYIHTYNFELGKIIR